MNNFFNEIDRTNAAYCRAMGLDATPYESKLSPDEVLRAALNNMPPARPMVWNPKRRPAPAPHCVVEIAFPLSRQIEQEALVGASIQRFYEDSRKRGCFVGD